MPTHHRIPGEHIAGKAGWATRGRGVAVALAVIALSRGLGCGGGSNSPNPASPSSGSTHQLSGMVVNSVTGASIPGAQLISGEVRAVSEATGAFSMAGLAESPANGASGGRTIQVRAEATNYWPRVFLVSIPPPKSLTVDLLPQGDGFDLQFFDRVFRPNGRGTGRWNQQPKFVIYPQQFDCVIPATGPCKAELPYCGNGGDERLTARHEDPEFVEAMREVLLTDSPLYTGGYVKNPTITLGNMVAPGTAATLSSLRPGNSAMGVIGVVFLEHAACSGLDGNGLITIMPSALSGRWLEFRRRTLSHEVAHEYGFDHNVGGTECSIMGGGDCWEIGYFGRPSPADILHGRVLYMRPPKTVSPDTNVEVAAY